jgi:hypothetical protein
MSQKCEKPLVRKFKQKVMHMAEGGSVGGGKPTPTVLTTPLEQSNAMSSMAL